MPLDPNRTDECRQWLAKAVTDLGAARKLAHGDDDYLAEALFHCQQAAEKAIKALLTWHEVRFRKTHSLEELAGQARGLDGAPTGSIEAAVELTRYVALYRYPPMESPPTREEFDTACLLASDCIHSIIDRLPAETHPIQGEPTR